MEFFEATTIITKIIFEGGLVAVDDGSGNGSGAAVGTNDAPLTIFETTRHYDYDQTAYAEYLSNGLQIPNSGLDARLLHKRYAALLWKYGEVKAQKPYVNDTKDPQRPKPNSIIPNEEQLVHID
ncbi:hypothetical protein BC332_19246 [Capsicum chinense]|nr:hypothetical protein BC332_19246 [Capsicum chinense]